jgi:thioredoxin 1
MPCKVMKPILDKFKEDNLELEVEEIDVEQNQELARQYEVRSIPHIIVFKD